MSYDSLATSTDNVRHENNHDENIPSEDYEDEETTAEDPESSQTYYCCPDPTCKKHFVKSHNLERQLVLGNHMYDCNKQSGLDMAAKIYSEQSYSLKVYQETLYDTSNQTVTSLSTMRNKGWALKTRRTVTRFSDKVKKYLQSILLVM